MIIATKQRAIPRLRLMTGTAFALTFAVGTVSTAWAGYPEQAKRIHDRLTGVPPSTAVLAQMVTKLSAGDGIGAADIAMQNDAFYDVTLKNWITPWTNRDQSPYVPLNDYTATVIGMIRDDVPFNTLLSADIIYVADRSKYSSVPAYSTTDDKMYQALEDQGIHLQDALVQRTQSSVTLLPAQAVAGVVTTRAAAQAFFVAGTNRAMFRFTMMNQLCHDLETIKDNTRVPDRIRQDVSRSPGGDSRIFLNNCIACHSGMDPLAGAYAYYNYVGYPTDNPLGDGGHIEYTPGTVQHKYVQNADNFKPGFITTDDSWLNYWRKGPNSLLGWSSTLPGAGNGAASMGMELANSAAFAQCQAKKVYKTVCLSDPDAATLTDLVSQFTQNNYSMKRLFAAAAVKCDGN